VLKCATATHSRSTHRSFSIRRCSSRVWRHGWRHSPNSGEIISLNKCGSRLARRPAFSRHRCRQRRPRSRPRRFLLGRSRFHVRCTDREPPIAHGRGSANTLLRDIHESLRLEGIEIAYSAFCWAVGALRQRRPGVAERESRSTVRGSFCYGTSEKQLGDAHQGDEESRCSHQSLLYRFASGVPASYGGEAPIRGPGASPFVCICVGSPTQGVSPKLICGEGINCFTALGAADLGLPQVGPYRRPIT
jgi:hypothetical protein